MSFVNQTHLDIPFRFQGRNHYLAAGEVIHLELPHPTDLAFRAGLEGQVVYREIHAGVYRFVHTDHQGIFLLRMD